MKEAMKPSFSFSDVLCARHEALSERGNAEGRDLPYLTTESV